LLADIQQEHEAEVKRLLEEHEADIQRIKLVIAKTQQLWV